ncbi:MAG: hypothetical protein FWD57_04235, partial [Polyangiaceae bacterium]|nr:hypothetical protein [Polyangiaceae bacterium]
MPTVISSFRSEAQRARVSVASAILLIAISVFGCSDRRSGSPLVPQDDVGGSFGSDNSPTDAHADETPSEPPLEEFGCVSDWPTQEPVALVPSLDLPRYSVVGVDKPPNKYGWRDLVFSGGSIASLSIGALVSYDVAARTFVQFAGLGRSCAVSSQPAIRRDTLRGFVSGCHGVVGLHPDFGVTPESSWGFSIQWSFTLDSNKNPYTEVTEVSTMLADPGGNLYFAATDDTFRAIRADDGAAVWTRGVQHDYRYTAYANARVGIGDRLFFGMSSVFKRDTGIQIASIKVDGKPVSVLGATYSGKLVGEVRAEGSDSASLVVLDQCGNLQWSWGNALGYMVLVGFDESLLVGEYN